MEIVSTGSLESEPSGSSLATWRQVYSLAKLEAPGFNFTDIPPEFLNQFQGEDKQAGMGAEPA